MLIRSILQRRPLPRHVDEGRPSSPRRAHEPLGRQVRRVAPGLCVPLMRSTRCPAADVLAPCRPQRAEPHHLDDRLARQWLPRRRLHQHCALPEEAARLLPGQPRQVRREEPGRKVVLHPLGLGHQVHLPPARIAHGSPLPDARHPQDDQLHVQLPRRQEAPAQQRLVRHLALVPRRNRFVFHALLPATARR